MTTLLLHRKMEKFATNYRSMNFSIEADSFKCTIFFFTNTLLFRRFTVKFAINCQNMNFFRDWFFLYARFSCLICYYFAAKIGQIRDFKGFKEWN